MKTGTRWVLSIALLGLGFGTGHWAGGRAVTSSYPMQRFCHHGRRHYREWVAGCALSGEEISSPCLVSAAYRDVCVDD